MSPPGSEEGNDDYFNDLSRQPKPLDSRSSSNTGSGETAPEGEAAPPAQPGSIKPKRIACILCRKRKLRCDGTRPTCGTCKRLSHDCAYDEVRKKSGPKRGYVKALEARLQQVETLLRSQDLNEQSREAQSQAPAANQAYSMATMPPVPAMGVESSNIAVGNVDHLSQLLNPPSMTPPEPFPPLQSNNTMDASPGEEPYPWEMIGLGLDEPLPPQDVINELHQIYFEKVHPSLPMVHRPRYLAAMNLAPHMRPPICLRYSMWCLAASITDKYDPYHELFYQRARKYAQIDEMKGHGEATITLAHCQAWILMGTYEFKQMYFPRAWLSAGRAVRLAQMMQLHRLDGSGLDVKQCLPPPKDWTEREERRRTFWMAFCLDRYASIGTGWPITIEERDIKSNLPASEEAFEKSKPPTSTSSLEQALSPSGAANLSPFGGVILMACLFGRNLTHLHRPSPDDNEDDIGGVFWNRHRAMESILLNTALALPDSLRLPSALSDPNAIFMNMAIHTSAICLHQAAIFKADKHRLPMNISSESKIRCVTAAAEIASIMRMISHMDLSAMNPFISFCVYVAARVFVQYLKNRPNDHQMTSSLQFLLQAMNALKRKNPLTESFLVQLDLDLDGAGIRGIQRPSTNLLSSRLVGQHTGDRVEFTESFNPIFEIRESQSANAPINSYANKNPCPGATSGEGGTSPGPPFHLASAKISLDVEPAPFGFVVQKTTELPTRQRNAAPSNSTTGTHPVVVIPDSTDQSEMDTSPDASGDHDTPSTINSRSHRGSSSHTSFTPPADHSQPSPGSFQHPAGSRHPSSPSVLQPSSGSSTIPISTAANSNQSFFQTTDNEFATLAAQFYQTSSGVSDITSSVTTNLGHDPLNTNFMLQQQWEMNASGSGTGMTPIDEGGWTSIMDGMAWENLGTSQAADLLGKRS